MTESELLTEISALTAALAAIAASQVTFTGTVTIRPSPKAQQAAVKLLAELERRRKEGAPDAV